jgi:hypothetical protein
MGKKRTSSKRISNEIRTELSLKHRFEKIRLRRELKEREEEKDKWVSENLTKERLRATGVLQ